MKLNYDCYQINKPDCENYLTYCSIINEKQIISFLFGTLNKALLFKVLTGKNNYYIGWNILILLTWNEFFLFKSVI